MNTAWFGLIGVIIGAVASGGLGLLSAHMKERSDKAAEDRREEVEVRRAARLIDADLMYAEIVAKLAVKEKKWWLSDPQLTSEGWKQYRDVIASKLPWGAWVFVIAAVEAVDHLQAARYSARTIQRAEMASDPDTGRVLNAADSLGLDVLDPGPAIPDTTVTRIEHSLALVTAGRLALASLVRGG